MRIFLDIGHPAHVHYFRNFIKLMQKKGHEFFVSARDKEVSLYLLDKYEISYFNRGRGASTLVGKLFYLIKADGSLLNNAKKFKPDLFLSFASPYAAHVAKILRKPHIAFTDTENARLGILSFAPFTECIVTPYSFQKDFGTKHLRFNGFMELCYLHPDRFRPDAGILKELGIKADESFILFRFVSWGASHDMRQSGISNESKINMVLKLSKRMKVFISAEGPIPFEIQEFKIQISPEKIHDLLSYAAFYIGEGATMASECAILGTPAIYVNSLSTGYLLEQERAGQLYSFRNSDGVFEKALELLNEPNLKEKHKLNRDKMLSQTIDVTSFMVWFVENYPESFRIMKENPDYQDRFR